MANELVASLTVIEGKRKYPISLCNVPFEELADTDIRCHPVSFSGHNFWKVIRTYEFISGYKLVYSYMGGNQSELYFVDRDDGHKFWYSYPVVNMNDPDPQIQLCVWVDKENLTASFGFIAKLLLDDGSVVYNDTVTFIERELAYEIFFGKAPEKDPYSEHGTSSTGGGGGTWARNSDPVPIPYLPTVSADSTGFISLFAPTTAQLKDLANYMWSDLWSVETFKKIFADPMDAILGLSVVPVSVPTSGLKTLVVGNMSTGVQMNKANTQYVEFDCGTLTLAEYYGSYLDYAPYTKIQIMLPFIGARTLSADDVVGKAVKVVYHIDILTGGCVAFIKCDNSVLYEFNGQCSVNIPVTSDSFTRVIQSLVSLTATGLATGISGGMSAGVLAGMAVSSVNNVMTGKPDISKSGNLSSSAGLMGTQTPYLIIEYPRLCSPAGQMRYSGYPAFITQNLGGLSGFTKVYEIHLDGVPATQTELDMIESDLKAGVFIENENPDTSGTDEIILYSNLSDNRVIGKSTFKISGYSGTYRDEISLFNPVFMIETDLPPTANYCYLRSFGRFYYIDSIECVRSGIYRFHCSVDVLQTYKNYILSLDAITERQESEFNLYLNDGTFKVYQNPLLSTIKFPNGFNTNSFVLAVAGD